MLSTKSSIWAALIGAFAGLFAYFIFSCPLDEEIVDSYNKSKAQLEQLIASEEATDKQIDEVIKSQASYFSPIREVAQIKKDRAELKQELGKIQTLETEQLIPELKRNRYYYQDQFQTVLSSYQSAIHVHQEHLNANKGLARVLAIAAYPKNRESRHQDVRSKITALSQQLLNGELSTLMTQKKTQYPEASSEIDARFQAITEGHQKLLQGLSGLGDGCAAPLIREYDCGVKLDNCLDEISAQNKRIAQLEYDLNHISDSIERILTDLKYGLYNGNYDPTKSLYAAKYEVITNNHTATSDWEPITKEEYSQYEDNIGMSVYSKAEGELTGKKQIAPPGYRFVDNPRYGEWRTDVNGNRYWAFHLQYLAFRNLIFASTDVTNSVRQTEYNQYQTYRKAGKTYYGSSNQYGTRGSVSGKRYKSSSYYTAHPTKHYSYSTSTYHTSSSSGRYKGSSYSSHSSRSSRSGSYRSSSYRSSSRSGGGK